MRAARALSRFIGCVVLATMCATAVPAGTPAVIRWAPIVHAPEFPDGLEWLNVDRPLKLSDLRGKVVLLDFWTYCCINCMHIIPDLKRLEAKYGTSLVVVGVHSAKFTTEQGTENIRQAILRYGIEHPVVNDKDFRVWTEYAARAWPTVVLIDTQGKVVAQASGEGVFDRFDAPIGELVAAATTAGTLDTRALKLHLERDRAPQSVLAYPGKVLADPASNRLFIADTNHNRIVIAGLDDYAVKDVVGSGGEGLGDGAYDGATFRRPQGMALDGDRLYVADTENHAIRRVDLAKRTVETIAGTGKQATEFNVAGSGKSVALSSPWDLVAVGGQLYIAMAGFHQIWRMDLATNRLEPFAGSGRENLGDGPRLDAALAQPSGLATDGTRLFVADSEVSALRTIDLAPDGAVRTVVGLGLFEFGDVDGSAEQVRLQHPLGVVVVDGALFVADTYNNKIKRADIGARVVRRFAGNGAGGFGDGSADSARFDEPGGISSANGKLYVADTNNNAIRVVDVKTGRVGTVVLTSLGKLAIRPKTDAPFAGSVVDLPEQVVAPGDSEVVVDIALPKGFALNPDAPFFVGMRSDSAAAVLVPPGSEGIQQPSPTFPLRLPFTARSGASTVSVDVIAYYCESERESLCYVKQLRFRVPIRVVRDGKRVVNIAYSIPSSETQSR